MPFVIHDRLCAVVLIDCQVHSKASKCVSWVDVEGSFTSEQPEEIIPLSAAEVAAKHAEVERLDAEKRKLADAHEAASNSHQGTLLNIFSSLKTAIDKDVSEIDSALGRVDEFASKMQMLAENATEVAGDAAPVSEVWVRLRGRAVQVDLSRVRSWGALLEAVSDASDSLVHSDSAIVVLGSIDAFNGALMTPGSPGVPHTPGAMAVEAVTTWDAYVKLGGGDFQVGSGQRETLLIDAVIRF